MWMVFLVSTLVLQPLYFVRVIPLVLRIYASPRPLRERTAIGAALITGGIFAAPTVIILFWLRDITIASIMIAGWAAAYLLLWFLTPRMLRELRKP